MNTIQRCKQHELRLKVHDLRSRVQACLLGVAIGDAMGMPVEIMTPDEIRSATDGRGVLGFIDPVQRRIHDTMNLQAGDTTDDWQLTRALVQSLIRCGKYLPSDVVQSYLHAYHQSVFGWGGTTTVAIQDFAEFYGDGCGGRAWFDPISPAPIPGKGCGNGVAMRIAPLGLWAAISYSNKYDKFLLESVIVEGLITHPDLRASVGALAVAYIIAKLVNDPILKNTDEVKEHFLKSVINLCLQAEDIWYKKYPDYPVTDNSFSERLIYILNNKLWNDIDQLREVIGTGCFTMESVPFSIGLFLSSPLDFRQAILSAVNAGGDTDTNAAMVGAMVGVNVGLEAIPVEWSEFRSEFAEPKNLGIALVKTVF